MDSNVIYSALYGASGAPRRILVLAAEGALEGLISTQVDREVRRNVGARIPVAFLAEIQLPSSPESL